MLRSLKIAKLLYSKSSSKIEFWSEDSDDYDPWVAADQADDVAKKSGIRIDSTKELKFIALNEKDEVIGAAWDSFDHDSEFDGFDGFEYSFDVAVLPEYRGGTGLKLIETCMDEFKNMQSEHPNSRIKLWVVNPKLVPFLERKYDFEIEMKHSDGSAHMYKD